MIEEEEEDETFFRNATNNINDSEDETDFVSASVIAAAELLTRKERKPRSPDVKRD